MSQLRLLLCAGLCWILAAVPCHAKEVKLSLGAGPATSLDQLNKDLLIARDRYANADPNDRDTLASALQQLVAQRAAVLKAALALDPEILFRASLPSGTADTLPPALRAELERPLAVEGVIEPTAAQIAKAFPYQLRDRQGRRWTLVVSGRAPAVVAGAMVKVTGLQVGELLVFRAADLQSESRSGLDTQPLRVAFVEPRQGAVLHGTATLRVEASGDQGVREIQFRKDGTVIGTTEAAPYELAWDTTREADGPHVLTAQAHDADMNLGDSAPVTVIVDNTPPRIQLTAPAPGEPLAGVVTLQADAHDAIGVETVKFLVDGLAVGVAVVPPYQVSWDSVAVANGPHTIEALALDRAQNTATTDQVPVRVINANHAPELIPIGAKTVQEGVTLAFTVRALDRDGPKDPLIYRMTNLPPWARFDGSTGQFYGTPDFTEASSAHPTKVYDGIRVEACDAQPLCDHEDIAISVINVNRPPVMEPLRPFTVSEGVPLTIKPLVSDPDGDALQCTASNLPPWMHFDPAACAASGTPGFELASQSSRRRSYDQVRFEACDPERACVAQSFSITVINVNRPPKMDRIGDRTVDEGKPLTIEVHASDPDHEILRLIAAPIPDGATFTERGPGTSVFAWTPRLNQAGSYAVTFTATDGTSQDAETVQLRVRETSLSISGTIRTDAGTRLAGATVELSRPGERTYEVRSDEHGMYLASDLPPGTYEIRVTAQTSNLPTSQIIHFGPLSRRVELTDRDLRNIDFTAYLKTR